VHFRDWGAFARLMPIHDDSNGPRCVSQLVIRQLKASAGCGVLDCGGVTFPCALGRTGIRAVKREGDGATPLGRFLLREVFYNPAAMRRPVTQLPLSEIDPADGWCDAPADRNYNRRVRLPYAASAENLWRSDGLYDLVVVLDYNIAPRMRQRGSAIFMHVARPGFLPTEGCIALRRRDLVRVLALVNRDTVLITADQKKARPHEAPGLSWSTSREVESAREVRGT
jgi:L,D-peptidoglycan transpeptidase YkuD (ErfK/YbiS/YcfS/YnhG family)